MGVGCGNGAQKKELKSEVGAVVAMGEPKQYLVLIFFLAGHCHRGLMGGMEEMNIYKDEILEGIKVAALISTD